MNMLKIRELSWNKAVSLGFKKNDSLPLLDEPTYFRSKDEVVDRIFISLALAAVSYGWDRKKSISWLERELDIESLSPSELQFLTGDSTDSVRYKEQIESMWALCWCIRVVSELRIASPCRPDFVRVLPDLKSSELGEAFRKRATLRDRTEIIPEWDLAYCLHWGVVSGAILADPTVKNPFIIVEKRRALEWLFAIEAWSDITLDT